jgi:D-glycero-D-manno-heptose 1,7-bisphosphate phosphatase
MTLRAPTLRRPTIRQCAVLAGGLGTRLGQLAATTPKPMLPCGDRPFVAWLLREFVRFGVQEFVVLAGHLSEAVEQDLPDIAAALPRPVVLRFSKEPVRAGTGGALFHAQNLLDPVFLLCNGDSLFETNLAAALAARAADTAEIRGRIVLRATSDTSRYGVVDLEGDAVTAFHPGQPPGHAGLINAGIYLLDRSVVETTTPICSLERDVMPILAAAGALRGTVGKGYFRDIGTPDDLARARTELADRLRRPALFLQRDCVLKLCRGCAGSHECWEWAPGAKAAIRAATQAGWHVFVIANQPGTALSVHDEVASGALHARIMDEVRAVGGNIDDIRYPGYDEHEAIAPYEGESDRREERARLLLDLSRAWELDPARCVMVGDTPADVMAAAAAGIKAWRFSGDDLNNFVRGLLPSFTGGTLGSAGES